MQSGYRTPSALLQHRGRTRPRSSFLRRIVGIAPLGLLLANIHCGSTDDPFRLPDSRDARTDVEPGTIDATDADGAAPDATADISRPDAAETDAATTDTAETDAAETDAATTDVAEADVTRSDVDAVDAADGSVDERRPDGGDASPDDDRAPPLDGPDATSDADGPTCRGCLIEGVCRNDRELDPSNGCRICDSTRSATQWSSNDDARCDDGEFCNGVDTCSLGVCSRHSGNPCDDGVGCNGVESCSEATHRCQPSASVCAAGELCDVHLDRCVPTCAGCAIAGACFPGGVANPLNSCQVCAPERASTAWTDQDDVPCEDGVFCNGSDRCALGHCSHHSGNPCDDGINCNGVEACDEATHRCRPSDSTCPPGKVCDAHSDSCIATCAGCLIGGSCFPQGATNPRNACQICAPDQSLTDWSANDGGRCDDGVFCNGVDTCLAGFCMNHSGSPCDQSMACAEERQRCCQPNDGTCGCPLGRAGTACEACVVHVDDHLGSDANDGRSWASAKATIQAGLDEAAAERCQVWVREGLYRPTYLSSATDPRSATFRLQEGVALYGGFAGTELSTTDRNVDAHPTVLSGDVGTPDVGDDNAYRVVTGAKAASLDGLTVQDARNMQVIPFFLGGGLYNEADNVIVNNCIFRHNKGLRGGAIVNAGGGAMTITGSTMADNGGNGAGIYAWTGTVRVDRSRFLRNTAYEGGAMQAAGGSISAANSVFLENTATLGGAISSGDSNLDRRGTVVLENCILAGNSADVGSAVNSFNSSVAMTACTVTGNVVTRQGFATIDGQNGSLTVQSCIVWGNQSTSIRYFPSDRPGVQNSDIEGGFAGSGNVNLDPLFVGTYATSGLLGLHLRAASPCIDAAGPEAPATDLAGSARFDDPAAPNQNGSSADMGAYEYRP
jgi:hypothetical protein